MKKALSFMLLFMLGAGNVAYASGAGSCVMGGNFTQSVKISAEKFCCSPIAACECKIKPVSKLYPQLANFTLVKDPAPNATAVSVFEEASQGHGFDRRAFSSKSPPGQTALFALHCAYRI